MAKRAIDLSSPLTAAVEKAGPSVLRLARHRYPASATVWDAAAGLVVTTRHAVLGCDDTVKLTLPGGDEREAQVVGTDPGTDLALLRTDPAGLVPIEHAELGELKVGELTLALGRPGQSVRASLRIVGVVGPEVRTPHGGKLDRYIETDRALPRGFSGGPLVDLDGRLIGIDTSGLLRGADIAVPLDTVKRVAAELVAHGSIRRGYLGVAVQRVRLPDDLATALGGQKSGALVVRVDPDSPASKSGLVLGDTIAALDGQAVTGPDRLRELLADRRGGTLAARIVRGGAVQDIQLEVGEA
ncbi:MAG TPA: trypsin-like peptidase domain-containing protein [Kofleriaceae bacterium]|jgi:S1-C subfamily serine protease